MAAVVRPCASSSASVPQRPSNSVTAKSLRRLATLQMCRAGGWSQQKQGGGDRGDYGFPEVLVGADIGEAEYYHWARSTSPLHGMAMTTTTTPVLNATTLGCSITCKDIEVSTRFYQDVLGFGVEQRFEREGKLAGAIIAAGDIHIVLNQDDG